jgi:hypothetical protein
MAHAGSFAASLAKNRNLATKRDFAGKPYRTHRFVVVREELQTKQAAVGRKLIDLPGYVFRVFVTNRSDSALEIWPLRRWSRQYRKRTEAGAGAARETAAAPEELSAKPSSDPRWIPCVVFKDARWPGSWNSWSWSKRAQLA